ncbi:Ser/Thr protein kinase RdoA (MazF antagonist) [Thermocatellispora tengchongensis]|uniref:Ser/Thr protein kinase RdoA (MazF antagonist) n=1 Tax=Thermocatellispora tengchongensis TaxID=1073253 RepID=A0A840PG08_9ACTN|nr:phosphotransferase [Thermocatellispora tengchongensis]MBB5136400.1 Ser/Thr protein kinase RdoA (MazF antagonist) [Thermocatellispora tengchongensis]
MSVAAVGVEVPLAGGMVSDGVVRVGDTVRRPVGVSGAAVHALLRHLEDVGFDRAPRVVGVDERGREILTWVEGEAATRPLREHVVSDEALAALARLLRAYHDATAGFRAPPGAVWEAGSNEDREPEIVGHCDVTPENVVFRGALPYALIDFDMARPTTRLFDIVTTLRHWAPIADPVDRDPLLRGLGPAGVGRRVRLFCDAYGLVPRERRRLTELARLRFDRSYGVMRARAAEGDGPWARMWESGAGQRIRRARAWLDAHEERLHEHLF